VKLAHCNEFIPSPNEVINLTKVKDSELKSMVRIMALQVLLKEVKKSTVVTNATGEAFLYQTYLHKN